MKRQLGIRPPDKSDQRNERDFISASLDKAIILWDADRGQPKAKLAGSARWTQLALAADNRRLVCGGWDGTIQVYDLETEKLLQTLKGHTDVIHSLLPLPDKRSVISASWDGTIRVWDLPQGKSVVKWDGVGQRASRAALTPDGKALLIAGPNGTISIWDLYAESVSHELTGHTAQITGLAIAHDGTVLSAGWDGTIRLWKLPSDE